MNHVFTVSSFVIAALCTGCDKKGDEAARPATSATAEAKVAAPIAPPPPVSAPVAAHEVGPEAAFASAPGSGTKLVKNAKIEAGDAPKKATLRVQGPAGWIAQNDVVGGDIGFDAPDGSARVKLYAVSADQKTADVVKLYAQHLFGESKVVWSPERDGAVGAAKTPAKIATGTSKLPINKPARAFSIVLGEGKPMKWLILAGVADGAAKNREEELFDCIRSVTTDN